MSRLIPQEMAKNGTAAEKSRMMVGGLKAYYSTWPGQSSHYEAGWAQSIGALFFNRQKGAREGALDRSLSSV
jgi:hypothetical protein